MSKFDGKAAGAPAVSGKAAKKDKNAKAVMNEEIEALCLKYYITHAEMPQYVANLGNSVQKQYKEQAAMMATHIGLITANMKQMEKAIKASKLTKASKDEILQWVEMFNVSE